MAHALRASSLHALLILTSKALSRSGFGDVQILDRRQNKQKTRYGGHELLCETELGGLPVKVVVKVVNDVVRLRMLDELAGTVVRRRADFGLIVTPQSVAKSAEKLVGSHLPVRIEVIDGPSLARMLIKYQIGTRGADDVDYAFFSELESQSFRIISFLAETT